MRLLLFFMILPQVIFSQIIPENNRIDWKPGIPGGIPEVNSPMVNVVTDYNADNTGLTNSKTAIQNAINSLNYTGGVVYIPTGKYKIKGTLKLLKNGVVLRGDGSDKTKLYFENPDYQGAAIAIVKYDRGNWQSIYNYTKGDTTISVANGSAFTVGKFAEIQQDNDADFMYTKSMWNQSWAQNAVGQIFEVKAVDGNDVTFKTPLHLTFTSSLNPTIRPQGFVENVGIEDLYLELATNSDVSSILMKNAAYCWVKNVDSYYSSKAHISSESTIGCVVRDSYFHRSHNYGGGGHGYGVVLGKHVTDWLVENNVFDSLRHAMIIHLGANGNVYGYNYSQNVLQGEGETDLNNGWIPPDISIHGHYSYMNLFESNSAQEVGINDYWGPAGPGNTYFRNRILSNESHDGISYYDHAQKQNVIGNSAIVLRDANNNAFNNLEHGNTINGTLIWDPSTPDHNLPNSYYLTEKPAFFDDIPWPLYGPEDGYSGRLPAQVRFEDDTETKVERELLSSPVSLSIYPNPFNPVTTISFNTTSKNSSVKIYNSVGREILSKRFNKPGQNSFTFNGSNFTSGIYLVKAISGNKTISKKIILRKH